jgi:hypothetical protein
MTKGKMSGHSLTNADVALVLGMVLRGDRDHDIAAWFGVHQGRIAEAKDGSHGSISAASGSDLPPKGPPGVKGRRLRAHVTKAIEALEKGNMKDALENLKSGLAKFNAVEA